MAAGKWQRYDSLWENVGEGTVLFDGSQTFEIRLYTGASNAGTLTNATLSQLTNEVAAANGYAAQDLTSLTWTRTGSNVVLDFADATWNASGGNIVARRAVIVRKGTVNTVADALVATCLLDSTNADVTATDGNPITIQISGVVSVDGGQAAT